MILNQGDCEIPVFSTTHIHAAAIDACIQALA
jgi:aspartate/glutamate racemase